jgi:hypothetical protein
MQPRVPQDKEKIIRPCPSIRGLRWRQLSEGTHSRSSPIPAVTIYCELGRSGSGDQCVGSNASPWHRCSGDTSIPGLNGARSQRLDRSRRSLAGGFLDGPTAVMTFRLSVPPRLVSNSSFCAMPWRLGSCQLRQFDQRPRLPSSYCRSVHG